MNWFLDNWRAPLEIAILWWLLYGFYKGFKSTRTIQVLMGVGVIVLICVVITYWLKFEVIGWLFTKGISFLAFALIVIFQNDIRGAFARLGANPWLQLFNRSKQVEFLELLEETVSVLSKKRVGALIAIERENHLKDQIETGVLIDGVFSKELMLNIFAPKTALHDGGVVLSADRVVAAGCIFPLTHRNITDRMLGLRHRAGLGMSENSDALVIVISEETGNISICIEGELESFDSAKDFAERVESLLLGHEDEQKDADEVTQQDSSDGDTDDDADDDTDDATDDDNESLEDEDSEGSSEQVVTQKQEKA